MLVLTNANPAIIRLFTHNLFVELQNDQILVIATGIPQHLTAKCKAIRPFFLNYVATPVLINLY
jgi:hypothetical protein